MIRNLHVAIPRRPLNTPPPSPLWVHENICGLAQNLDLQGFPGRRSRVYFTVSHWWRSMETVRILKIFTPPLLTYYSNRILRGTAEQSDDVWRILRSEFSVLGTICFLSAGRDGETCNKASDPRMNYNQYGFWSHSRWHFIVGRVLWAVPCR